MKKSSSKFISTNTNVCNILLCIYQSDTPLTAAQIHKKIPELSERDLRRAMYAIKSSGMCVVGYANKKHYTYEYGPLYQHILDRLLHIQMNSTITLSNGKVIL